MMLLERLGSDFGIATKQKTTKEICVNVQNRPIPGSGKAWSRDLFVLSFKYNFMLLLSRKNVRCSIVFFFE